MTRQENFRQFITEEYRQRIEAMKTSWDENDILKVDLHCHDHNSDKPDELWGRILRLPETWLSSEDLLRCLESHRTGTATITNHNNARSCWDLLDQGRDILPGAEFTCFFKEYGISLHVLAYGFTPDQEEELKSRRHDLLHFQSYAAEHDIPTVLPHPLFFSRRGKASPPEFFEKLLLIFERFEVLNGQRDVWQNLLTLDWLQKVNRETISILARKHHLDPTNFCRDPYRKRLTGGSDDHMGIFAGSCGTYLYIPGLKNRLADEAPSRLALEALRHGELIPYGILGKEDEKLTITFLDYFCQVAMNMKDTGLLRLLLHQGSLMEKFACLAIANGMMELRRHRTSMVFLKTFHRCLSGKSPSIISGLSVSSDYKPIFRHVTRIARSKREEDAETFLAVLRESIPAIFKGLNLLSAHRVLKERVSLPKTKLVSEEDVSSLMDKFELPVHLRSLFEDASDAGTNRFSFNTLLDRLSFPLMISSLIASSSFTALHALYKGRDIIDAFAERSGRYRHPRRVLWLTDTLFDHNGVSTALQAILTYVRHYDLPIDFLVCGDEALQEDHLHILPTISDFSFDGISPQRFRIPDLLQIQKIFSEGGYDRVICSTEMFMGFIGLFLKQAYQIPVYLYMHTDWLDFFTRNLRLGKKESNKIRRLLRSYYKFFSGIFVLNSEHRAWLTSYRMGIPKEKTFQTAHWADPVFKEVPPDDGRCNALLYAGRLSEEKGVMDLVRIDTLVRETHPEIELWFVGEGPVREALEERLPHARFFGWVSKEELARIYSAAGILVLPSTFDTFGCVVLEAMNCGLPVAAYSAKGPADIIEHEISGFLANSPDGLAQWITAFFADDVIRDQMSRSASERGRCYNANEIMNQLLKDIVL